MKTGGRPRLDYNAHDPLRKAGWRWTVAQRKVDSGLRVRPWEEQGIQDAVQFIKFQNARGAAAAYRESPDLFKAQVIYQSDGLTRNHLEARLLSGESLEIIATKTGVSPAVVSKYDRLFFEVAGHREAGDWLLVQVIQFHPPYVDEGRIWKYISLGFGPVILDLLVGDHLGTPHPDPAGRHRQAMFARLIARDFWASWRRDYDAARAVDDMCKLMPGIGRNIKGKREERLQAVWTSPPTVGAAEGTT